MFPSNVFNQAIDLLPDYFPVGQTWHSEGSFFSEDYSSKTVVERKIVSSCVLYVLCSPTKTFLDEHKM